MHNSWLDRHPGPFRVGDRVAFHFGTAEAEGVVVEDRGNLDVGGKRVYGVRFRLDDVSDEMYMEYDAERLHPAAPLGQANVVPGSGSPRRGSPTG